jgi:hypothetical protein
MKKDWRAASISTFLFDVQSGCFLIKHNSLDGFMFPAVQRFIGVSAE